jgi:hypothetical protein
MKKVLMIIIGFALLTTCLGCGVMPAGIAPSANHITAQDYQILGKSTGSASHLQLFNFIPLGKADIDAAIEEAIVKQGGDNLINVRYWQKTTWILIGTRITFLIEGDVIKYTSEGMGVPPSKPHAETPLKPQLESPTEMAQPVRQRIVGMFSAMGKGVRGFVHRLRRIFESPPGRGDSD